MINCDIKKFENKKKNLPHAFQPRKKKKSSSSYLIAHKQFPKQMTQNN